ncbi:hypothetical protein MML48_2g00003172 [Holotrichia oblita]|uniref:Uncharacterized protein n=1 Tax=Holotrichia oblita TaxID=644536 RepID=A0ACB9TLL6_HOLOL|nr:hypothetical protein MML48_2g00003172 [Holotrichia oblita]
MEKKNKIVVAAITAVKYYIDVVTNILCDDEEETNIPVRIENYVDKIIPNFTNEQFRQHFRMNRSTFEQLLPLISLSISTTHIGRPSIAIEKQLLSVLWILATPDSYRSVGERFNLSKSSLSENFVRIINALNKIAKTVICWPREEEMETTINAFRNIAGMDNVVGAIDGTFIPIKAPHNDPEVYKTRKLIYAITLQAVCNASLKFTDCFVGYPGSVSDTRIFRNSGLYKEILLNERKYFPDCRMYIIGDKAYPLLGWCIPPYIDRGNLTANQLNFNRTLSRTRQVIERAFALLFGRFRRLKFLDMNKTELIPATVMACCVLHNICLDNEINLQEFMAEGNVNVDGNDSVEGQHYGNLDEQTRNGNIKRNELCRSFTRQ